MTGSRFRLVELTANRISFVRISCDAKLFDTVPRRLYKVQGCCVVCRNKTHGSKEAVRGSRLLRGLQKQDSRGDGEGVPTDLRGRLTESPLRKSKNLAKRRRQRNRTKSRSKKGSEMLQTPAKTTFDAKTHSESNISPKGCEKQIC